MPAQAKSILHCCHTLDEETELLLETNQKGGILQTSPRAVNAAEERYRITNGQAVRKMLKCGTGVSHNDSPQDKGTRPRRLDGSTVLVAMTPDSVQNVELSRLRGNLRGTIACPEIRHTQVLKN